MLKVGGLAVALDYDAAWSPAAMRECDRIVADDAEQLSATRRQGPHLSQVPENGYADLSDIVAGTKPGRQNETERIMCLNLGIAIADIAAAKLLYDRAVKQGIGVNLPL